MIEVQDLTKSYGDKIAVDHISFEVGKGEIVGFLGPNGAGKSTTMRILTGYLAATSGRARIGGCDVYTDSMAARRKIGYMPETVPLYSEMRVKEYLHFRAKLKGLEGEDMRKRVGEVMNLCSLHHVRRKLIANLSKGYRQRLGLADALVHKPDLLILDEPTNGLDPNQIRQVRELIKELGQQHTILLSTHILSEVEITCERVIIIDEGKIKATGSPHDLVTQLRVATLVTAEIQGPTQDIERKLKGLEGVKRVDKEPLTDDWTKYEMRVNSHVDIRQDIFDLVVANKWELRELKKHEASLEDAFVDLTNQGYL